MDDFSSLTDTQHMLEWLAADPFRTIRRLFEQWLDHEVPGSRLNDIHVVSSPQWLTGTRPLQHDSSRAILLRTGVTFEFDISVFSSDGYQHQLKGVFTWVAVHLDTPQEMKQQVWFDFGGTLDSFGSDGELASRLYFA